MSNAAYLSRINFTGMVAERDLSPCDICKGPPGAYHIVRDKVDPLRDKVDPLYANEFVLGYLYRRRGEGFLANAWCICNSDLCFNMALISDLSEWHE